MQEIKYIGCLGYGNVGDEACWEAAQLLLRNRLARSWRLSAVNGYDFDASVRFDSLILGGGTLLSAWGNLGDVALAEAMQREVPYFIFGTGTESEEWEGAPSESDTNYFVSLVSNSSLIGVRGPISRDYLVKLGIPEERVTVIGDLALSLQSRRARTERVASNRNEQWIGVNIGTSFGRIYGGNERHLRQSLTVVLNSLMNDGWCIRFVPMWHKDLEFQDEVAKALAHQDRLEVIDSVLSPTSTRDAISGCEFVIGMKLHSCIFSAIEQIPFLALAYRPKVEDFARSIKHERFMMRTDASSEEIRNSFDALVNQAPSVSSNIRQQVQVLKKNLEDFAIRISSQLCHQ